MDKYISVKTCTLYQPMGNIHTENQEMQAKQTQKKFCELLAELSSTEAWSQAGSCPKLDFNLWILEASTGGEGSTVRQFSPDTYVNKRHHTRD